MSNELNNVTFLRILERYDIKELKDRQFVSLRIESQTLNYFFKDNAYLLF